MASITEIARCRALIGGCPGPAGPAGPGVAPLYASFISRTSQNPNITTPTAITYDTRTIGTIGVAGSYPTSQIIIPTAGTYKIVFSAQCNTTSGNHYLEIWPAINGTSVPDSNTRIRIQSQQETCLTVEYFLSFSANDTLQFYMIGETGAVLQAFTRTPPTIPDIPSIIVTIMRIE